MSRWFINVRQEFIYATFKQFGQVNRQQLMDEFDISAPLASKDIQDFIRANPAMVCYDVSAKCYLLCESHTSVVDIDPETKRVRGM